MIGDLQTAALISVDGTIDWFCAPRFDSPSLFASLLDAENGGHFKLGVTGAKPVTKQLYVVDTAVLITRFLTEEGVAEIIDFMPVTNPTVASQRHRIVRLARVVRGEVTFAMECAPRFDYGRQSHELTLTDHHARFVSADSELSLHLNARLSHVGGKHRRDGVARAQFTLHAGETSGMILTTGPVGTTAGSLAPTEVARLLEDTIRYWREWIGRSTYVGRWRETVNRSALTLKLMTYAPTGAMVAAPTAGLPEQVGGERNWDYRYTWVRDSSFALTTLTLLGYTEEAVAFLRWLARRIAPEDATAPETPPLRIMYRVDGSTEIDEIELDHLAGYRGSRPVRIGNGAAGQLQLDIFGEAIDAVFRVENSGHPIGYDVWNDLVRIIDWLDVHWDQPDDGIWETRGGRQDFVYSRLMCWVAFDRAIRIATNRGFPAPLLDWQATRDRIYNQVMTLGFDHESEAFVQHFGSGVLDASLLKMPLVGFIAARDPRWLSTLDAISDRIVSDSLVFRYDPTAAPDGLAGDEGTFSLCTFWYVDALARAGQVQLARLIFEQMLTYSNHLGLYSEEIGATGEQLGNFPQAFTHLALIAAAVSLNDAIESAPTHLERLIPDLRAVKDRYVTERLKFR